MDFLNRSRTPSVTFPFSGLFLRFQSRVAVSRESKHSHARLITQIAMLRSQREAAGDAANWHRDSQTVAPHSSQ